MARMKADFVRSAVERARNVRVSFWYFKGPYPRSYLRVMRSAGAIGEFRARYYGRTSDGTAVYEGYLFGPPRASLRAMTSLFPLAFFRRTQWRGYWPIIRRSMSFNDRAREISRPDSGWYVD